jgi:hypothetical protein
MDNNHTYGSVQNIMKILHIATEGGYTNTEKISYVQN